MRKHHKYLIMFVAVLALLPFSALRGEDKPAPADPKAEVTRLESDVKKLTDSNAELVRSVQIVQGQRNQIVSQLMDTQAQVQLLSDRNAALEKHVTELEAVAKKAEPPKAEPKKP